MQQLNGHGIPKMRPVEFVDNYLMQLVLVATLPVMTVLQVRVLVPKMILQYSLGRMQPSFSHALYSQMGCKVS